MVYSSIALFIFVPEMRMPRIILGPVLTDNALTVLVLHSSLVQICGD